jgi:hypothetical protein
MLSKNVANASPTPCSRASCVIHRGSLAENRTPRGTLAAQRSNVRGWCGRWNVELISTTSKRVA